MDLSSEEILCGFLLLLLIAVICTLMWCRDRLSFLRSLRRMDDLNWDVGSEYRDFRSYHSGGDNIYHGTGNRVEAVDVSIESIDENFINRLLDESVEKFSSNSK